MVRQTLSSSPFHEVEAAGHKVAANSYIVLSECLQLEQFVISSKVKIAELISGKNRSTVQLKNCRHNNTENKTKVKFVLPLSCSISKHYASVTAVQFSMLLELDHAC